MKTIQKYLIHYLWTFLSIFISSFLITTIYYYDFVSSSVFSILLFFCFLLPIFINSIILGKDSIKQGYWEGIKFGFGIIIFLFLFTILSSKFQWKLLFYYFIILFTTILGSIIGINHRSNENS